MGIIQQHRVPICCCSHFVGPSCRPSLCDLNILLFAFKMSSSIPPMPSRPPPVSPSETFAALLQLHVDRTCPWGHLLEMHGVLPYEFGKCDICENILVFREPVARCAQCEYDLCLTCAKQIASQPQWTASYARVDGRLEGRLRQLPNDDCHDFLESIHKDQLLVLFNERQMAGYFAVRRPTLHGGIAWVAAKHIGHCQRMDRPNWFRPLLEEDWWRSSWQRRLSEFIIKVKEQHEGGTYVCLMGGHPWRSENGTCAQVHDQIHWTIAKCAGMTRSERADLARKLNYVLASWPRLRPLERPLKLLRFPSIRWNDPNRHGYLTNEKAEHIGFQTDPA